MRLMELLYLANFLSRDAMALPEQARVESDSNPGPLNVSRVSILSTELRLLYFANQVVHFIVFDEQLAKEKGEQ